MRNINGHSDVFVDVMNKRYSFSVRKKGDSKPFFLEAVKEAEGSKTSPGGTRPRVPPPKLRRILGFPFGSVSLLLRWCPNRNSSFDQRRRLCAMGRTCSKSSSTCPARQTASRQKTSEILAASRAFSLSRRTRGGCSTNSSARKKGKPPDPYQRVGPIRGGLGRFPGSQAGIPANVEPAGSRDRVDEHV